MQNTSELELNNSPTEGQIEAPISKARNAVRTKRRGKRMPARRAVGTTARVEYRLYGALAFATTSGEIRAFISGERVASDSIGAPAIQRSEECFLPNFERDEGGGCDKEREEARERKTE